ncbi:type II secretion system F family protein [Paenibacillus sp. 2TAB23]|uniref:type II secretion system F family protein n=1 Tax=Paenibacillus sp. 2TAB23 TaxID=3233004 RepID=UPI003F94BD3B
MNEWTELLLYTGFAVWSLSMLLFWRYRLHRIALLKRLGLIKLEKKKKEKWTNRFSVRVFAWSKQLAPIGRRFRMFSNEEELERKIALAGYPGGLQLDSFYGFRFLCLFSGLLGGTILSWLGIGGGGTILALFAAGLVFPSMWIRAAAARRQEQIAIELPDFMDAMSVTLQAGVPLDPAMKQIVKTMEGPLQEELSRFQQELDIGVPREQAYLRLMHRNQCKDLETLILSLIQGSKLGVPIANTFKLLAEDMRESRIGRIKERAAKAGPKVTLITTFVILPAVILCVIGLLVLNFMYNPEGLGISWDAFNM